MTMLAINANIRQKRFQIPIHLGLGHEAIGCCRESKQKHKQDCLILSHRNMHYNVANQPDAQKIFDEYDLQDSGLGQGKYGSMNLIHPEQGLVYYVKYFGQQSMCCKWNCKSQSSEKENGTDPSVTIVVTGDGAMEEGLFYESLLMSKTSKVPMIIIVENNGWSMYTQITKGVSR